MSKWKLIRLTEPQFDAVWNHGRRRYKAETVTEALRKILEAYFAAEGIEFPMEIGVWGDIENIQKGSKAFVTNGKKSKKDETE